jgi:hypothetical protein
VNTYTVEDEQGRKHPRPRRCTVTRTSESRMTEDDLRDLAAEYPAGTRVECGRTHYLITPDGHLVPADDTDHEKTAPRSDGHRGAENPPAVPPADTATDLQHTHGRSRQGQRSVPAARTGRQITAPHASSLRDDDQPCMDEFWQLINTIARVDPAGRRAVHQQVATALSTSWTAKALAEWVTHQLRSARARNRVSNPGGFVVSRLKDIPAAENLQPEHDRPTPPVPLPHCDQCGAAEGDPLALRMRTTTDGRLRRCECRTQRRAATEPADRPSGQRADPDERGRSTLDSPTHVTDPLTELDLHGDGADPLRPPDRGDHEHVHDHDR